MRASIEFEAFYLREHARLVASLTALSGDRDAAREATDEAFVRALERWKRVAAMESPAGWTYRVALNALRRTKRRAAMERRVAPPPAMGSQTMPDAELWDVVRALPERQRQAVALRYVADLTEADIATAMRISRGSVASTLFDARARLAEVLGEPELVEEL
ncbi:MAG TPA: sigma-70 family RNA polymerase sigma factor [Acidimicrobiia bacterium]|nr:sigma-70 family RNA polymerase sigma factor [Acidimicrobiia bacterium]